MTTNPGISPLRWHLLLAAAAFLAAPGPALAREGGPFPSRPLRLVLLFGPGGVSNTLGRLIAEQAQPLLGQPVVIDRQPVSNGVIATEAVANTPKNGTTISYMAYGSLFTGLVPQGAIFLSMAPSAWLTLAK